MTELQRATESPPKSRELLLLIRNIHPPFINSPIYVGGVVHPLYALLVHSATEPDTMQTHGWVFSKEHKIQHVKEDFASLVYSWRCANCDDDDDFPLLVIPESSYSRLKVDWHDRQDFSANNRKTGMLLPLLLMMLLKSRNNQVALELPRQLWLDDVLAAVGGRPRREWCVSSVKRIFQLCVNREWLHLTF